MNTTHQHILTLAISAALAASLSACGGGGGNVRPNTQAPVVTPPTAPTPPVAPTAPAYRGEVDNVLVPTHVADAHAAGFNGKGVKLAVMDSGIDPSAAPFAGLRYTFASFIDGGSSEANDNTGHGSIVTAVAAGGATSGYAGGVAPGADVYAGQICTKSPALCSFTKDSADAAYRWGARIFSLSFGGSSTQGGRGLEAEFQANNYYTYAYQPLVDGGSLLVWATGNDGGDTTTKNSVAPYYLPALAKGWLAVTNVTIGARGEVTGLHGETNLGGTQYGAAKCNIAAAWCLAAPGFVYNPDIKTEKYPSGHTTGTSNATAVVGGVAALVSQAFPWMDGHNLQQTLLTTATHLTDVTSGRTTTVRADYTPGTAYTPNETYGWGLVDAARAVKGPGQFVGTFAANVHSNHSTFSNPISGSGSLTLSGWSGGQLTLAAANTYTGGTTIQSGTLVLKGSLASQVTIKGGVLAGDGTIKANVSNAGGTLSSVSATDGKGLTVTGNYTAGAGSTTGIVLSHPLAVGGTAALAGTLALSAPDQYTPKSSEPVLTAGRVSGTFGRVNDQGLAFYSAAVNYTGTGVNATLTRRPTAQATSMSSPVLVAASNGLDSALSLADGWSQTDYAGHAPFLGMAARLMSAPAALADASVASLSGEVQGSITAVEAQTSAQVDHAVALRQNSTLAGGPTSVWVQGYTGNHGLAQDGYASARTTGNGTLLGFDVPVTDDLTVGILGGRNRATSRFGGLAGQVRERDTLAGIYASYRRDDAYLAGRATWTVADLRVNRAALLGNAMEAIGASRKDGLGRATLEAGKSFGSFTPYVAFTALRIHRDGFAEQGAGGFGLAARSNRHGSTSGTLGVRWNADFTWFAGESSLTGHAAWTHAFSGTDTGFDATLVGAPDAAFRVTGQSLPTNGWEAGAMLDTRVNGNWSWFIDVDAQSSSGRYHAFSANAGVRYVF